MKNQIENIVKSAEDTFKEMISKAIMGSSHIGKCDPEIAAAATQCINFYVDLKEQLLAVAEGEDNRYAETLQMCCSMTKILKDNYRMIEKMYDKIDELEDKISDLKYGKPAEKKSEKKVTKKAEASDVDEDDTW